MLLTRWARFAAGWGGPLDHQIASLTVVAGLLGAWGWSMFDVSRPAEMERSGMGQWSLAAQAFKKNRVAVIGVMVVVWVYLIALITPLIAPHDPATQASLLTARLVAPGGEFPLGTDHPARDVFSRIMYGARISLSIGFVAVGISITIGTLLGAVSGYLGGWVDTVVMRFVDMVISFPRLVLLIAIVALFESNSIFLIMAVLGLTQWPQTARIVRGEVLSLREREFIEAARALGLQSQAHHPPACDPQRAGSGDRHRHARRRKRHRAGGWPFIPRSRSSASHTFMGVHGIGRPWLSARRLVDIHLLGPGDRADRGGVQPGWGWAEGRSRPAPEDVT